MMFKKSLKFIKNAITSKEVLDRAIIAEDILWGRATGADSEAVQAVSQLTTALCNNNCEGVVDAGIFIFFKVKNNEGSYQIFHKRLSVKERSIINEHPTILENPYKIFENLEKCAALGFDQAAEMREVALNHKLD